MVYLNLLLQVTKRTFRMNTEMITIQRQKLIYGNVNLQNFKSNLKTNLCNSFTRLEYSHCQWAIGKLGYQKVNVDNRTAARLAKQSIT